MISDVLELLDGLKIFIFVGIFMVVILFFIVALYKKQHINIKYNPASFEVNIGTQTTAPNIQLEPITTTLVWQNEDFEKIGEMNLEDAKIYANNLNKEGAKNWRLPTREELRTLANIELYGEYDNGWEKWYQKNKQKAITNTKGDKHFIKEAFIENMPKNSSFWTSDAKNEEDIYRVNFHLGCNDVCYDEDRNYVLCVRDKTIKEN